MPKIVNSTKWVGRKRKQTRKEEAMDETLSRRLVKQLADGERERERERRERER